MKHFRNYYAVVCTGISIFLTGCGGSSTTGSVAPQPAAKAIYNAQIVQSSANPAVITVNSTYLGLLKEALKTLPLESNSYGVIQKKALSIGDLIPPGMAAGRIVNKSIGTSTQTFCVDSAGLLTKQSIFGSYSAQYTYQRDSQNIITAVFSDRNKYSYVYKNDLITSYTTGPYTINISYLGTERKETYENTSVNYDTNNKIIFITDGKNTARIVRTYDAKGRQKKIEVFYTEGAGNEVLQAVNESDYGDYGIISSTTTLYDKAIPEYNFTTVTETTTYDRKGNKIEENYIWKDDAGSDLLRDREIYTGYTYDTEDLTSLSEYTIEYTDSVTYKLLKLVSGKNNQ